MEVDWQLLIKENISSYENIFADFQTEIYIKGIADKCYIQPDISLKSNTDIWLQSVRYGMPKCLQNKLEVLPVFINS